MDTTLDAISIPYVKTLPHATYTAVGINFKAIAQFDTRQSADSFIVDKIVSPGPWKEFNKGLRSASLRFIYDLGEGLFNLNLEPADFQRAGSPESKPVILASANFHRDLPKDLNSAASKMIEIMQNWNEDKKVFVQSIQSIFNGEINK